MTVRRTDENVQEWYVVEDEEDWWDMVGFDEDTPPCAYPFLASWVGDRVVIVNRDAAALLFDETIVLGGWDPASGDDGEGLN